MNNATTTRKSPETLFRPPPDIPWANALWLALARIEGKLDFALQRLEPRGRKVWVSRQRGLDTHRMTTAA